MNVRKIITSGLLAAFATSTIIATSSGQAAARPTPRPPAPAAPVTKLVPVRPAPVRWQEDSLPPVMLTWIGYPNKLTGELNPIGTLDGHQHCWEATGDTSLYMCPDGYWSYS